MTNPITCGGELPPCGNCEDCNTAIRADMTDSTRKTARELAAGAVKVFNTCDDQDDERQFIFNLAAAIEKALRERPLVYVCPYCGEDKLKDAARLQHHVDSGSCSGIEGIKTAARHEGYEAGRAYCPSHSEALRDRPHILSCPQCCAIVQYGRHDRAREERAIEEAAERRGYQAGAAAERARHKPNCCGCGAL